MVYPLPTREQEDEILAGINYTREQLTLDKALLRQWLDEQEHYPESRKAESDTFLVSYLVGCKGSMEKTKKKLDKYYSIRGHGDLFQNRNTLDHVRQAELFQFLAPMPQLLPDGCVLTVIGLSSNDLSVYEPAHAFRRIIMYSEFKLRQGTGIERGDIIVGDMKGMTGTFITRINPSHFKPFVTWIQDALPIRVKRIILVNVDPLFDTIVNTLLRPIMNKKLQDKLVVTSDADLSKYLEGTDFLPTSYGGKGGDHMAISDAFKKTFHERMTPIVGRLGELTDESKRPTLNGFTDNPNFGAFGTIKSLVVD